MPALSVHELRDRCRATLLGLAIGDALGFPFEGAPPGAVAGRADLVDDFAPRPRGRFARGQYGEGGVTALAIAEGISERGGVDGSVLAGKLAALYRDGELPVAGRALRESSERLLAGSPWMSSGAPIGNAGCGPAVRAVPVGLWAAFDPGKLPREAHVVSVITHKDPRAAAGAAAVAAAVAHGLSGEKLGADTVSLAATLARSLHDETAQELAKAAELCTWDAGPAALSAARLGLRPGERPSGPGISCFVVPAVAFAMWAAVHGEGDFRATIGSVVRTGGAVDAIGGIAGAIVGAHYGCAAIPSRLRRGVRDADRILEVADALLEARLVRERAPAPAARAARTGVRGPGAC